MALNSL